MIYRKFAGEEILIWQGDSPFIETSLLTLDLAIVLYTTIILYPLAILVSGLDIVGISICLILFLILIGLQCTLIFDLIENTILWLNIDILEKDIYLPPENFPPRENKFLHFDGNPIERKNSW